MIRKKALVNGEYYHVFNKSIAGFQIFNEPKEFRRMLRAIRFFQWQKISVSFSVFIRSKEAEIAGIDQSIYSLSKDNKRMVRILSFCLMPTHIHLVLEQLDDNGISRFMNNLQNSYTRYFNTKHKRKGPLWVGPFKNVLIETQEQLLHVTRYVHLNPTTAGLVRRPQDWLYSSYNEYLGQTSHVAKVTSTNNAIDIAPADYRKFVDGQMDYQKELGIIKKLFLDC